MDSPHVPSPMEEANAQKLIDDNRNRMETEKAAREKAIADAEKADRIAKAGAKQTAGYNTASQYDDKQAGYRGYDQALLDKYKVSNIYQDAIDATKAGFGEEDSNVSFGEGNAYDNAVATGQGTYRNDLSKAIDLYAGTDFANKSFGATADDPILDAILGSQYTDTQAQIDAAHDRGTLSDVGYDKAIAKLNEQKTIGRSTLEGLGGGVLANNRKQLDDAATNIRNQAAGATFANPYDTTAGQKSLTDLTTNLTGGLEGDVRKAVGSQSFFDPAAILGYGTTQQGFYNPSKKTGTEGANPLLTSFTEDATKKDPLAATGGTGTF